MKVAVAIDGSEGSSYTLKWVIDHMFTSGDATAEEIEKRGTIVLLHAKQPFEHYVFPAGPAVYATSSVIDSVKKAQEQSSSHVLDKALQLCEQRLVKAEKMIVDGDPKDMICQAAEQLHVDLLVVGSRGISKLKRAILGSVSDYVAHHATCPVLIVKPPKIHH